MFISILCTILNQFFSLSQNAGKGATIGKFPCQRVCRLFLNGVDTTREDNRTMGSEAKDVTAVSPKEQPRQGWKEFFYDPDTGAVLTRTWKSWALITLFFVVYYACLSGFFFSMLTAFNQTLYTDRPKWQTTDSFIGKSPGLGLTPGHSITFNQTDGSSWKRWSDKSKELLKKYENAATGKSKAKPFDLGKLGPCGKDNYGYDQGKPCVFLKLSKIYGLKHEYYDPADLPKEMPEELKKHIATVSAANQVWVECHGRNSADKEGITAINYYPAERGFPEKFFPYEGQDGYQDPLVAVQMELKPDKRIHIECKAWAKNIDHSHRYKVGMASLEIMRQK